MYLKSIEVQGFKSFANKIVFDFHNGITGIVGPNGSGKSNVADAVRWVLGEQKVKQLRSSSMQDVIFSGTENRKPLSYAYVAITMDNSDHELPLEYNEVTVARRIYRSGESEYLLNGVTCRLRDIHELFYDTGIGKEGYSIIGQGQIDKILSGKPEDRRELFDEAAGIVKFKRRKLAAQKKLDSEQQNLLRVTDILHELERQVGPLKRQSESAREYLKNRDQLKIYDTNLYVLEAKRIDGEIAKLDENIKISKDEYDAVTAKLEAARVRYEEISEQLASIDAKIEDIHTKISESGVENQKYEGDINVLKEQIKSIEASEESFQGTVSSLNSNIETHKEDGDKYAAHREALIAEFEKAAAVRDEIEARLENGKKYRLDCENSIKSGDEEKISLMEKRVNLTSELKRLDTLIEQGEIKKAELNKSLIAYKSDETDFSDQLKELQSDFDEICKNLEKAEKKRTELDEKRADRTAKAEAIQKELDSAKEQLMRNASRYESLQNIAERYEGYGNTVKKVMEQKDSVSGIIGVVADLIKVDKKYEIALETAFGGSLQNVVTEDENTAKKLISYLKDNKFGRATFLPLTSVKGHSNNPAEKAVGEKGVIGLADTLVKTDKRFEEIISSLVGRILIVDTVDNAIAIQKKYKQSLRLVTLTGELFAPGGSITGGAYKNNSNLLGRNRELEALEKQMKQDRVTISELKDKLDDMRTSAELLIEDLDDIIAKQQALLLEKNAANITLTHTKELLTKQADAYDNIVNDIAAADEEKKTVLAEKEKVSGELASLKNREIIINTEKERMSNMLSEADEKIAGLQDEYAAAVLDCSKIEQEISFDNENIARISGEIRQLENEIKDLRERYENSENDIQAKKNEIEALRELIIQSASDKTELENELSSANEDKEKLTKEQKTFFDAREEMTDIITNLDKELYRLEGSREKFVSAGESLDEYMWNEYELTRHTVKFDDTLEVSGINELKKLINEIRAVIKKLGPVNIAAIEEYKEVSERYEFLKVQHEDLVESEKTLMEIIADLDKGMHKQFNEKFAEIKVEFNKVFKHLFGGGTGTLELTESEDVLESGISIIAQPPGKKLQNMMQLSGGEKALTAISLLFAIQNLKPSPFCLLDEIEAALDDSNVDRFAAYLHKLTKNTQFIVITHRRGTMNAADRLYGITMQEKGVSALVSVNLIENELDG